MADDRRNTKVTRRSALRLLAAAHAAAALGGAALAGPSQQEKGAAPVSPEAATTPAAKEPEAASPPSKPSRYAKFVAKNEEGLTSAERKRLEKQLPGIEGALRKIRDFNLPDDVEPALTFRALRAAPPRRP